MLSDPFSESEDRTSSRHRDEERRRAKNDGASHIMKRNEPWPTAVARRRGASGMFGFARPTDATQAREPHGEETAMKLRQFVPAILSLIGAVGLGPRLSALDPAPVKVLFIGKAPDHPHGTHMYMHTSRVLARCIERNGTLEKNGGVRAIVSNGWPKDPKALEGVRAIVLYATPGAEFLLDGPGAREFQAMVRRGVGVVTLHWASSVFEKNLDRLAGPWGEIFGGYWVSNYGLSTDRSPLKQLVPDHPICRGWKEYELHDEFYLKPVIERATPLLRVTTKGQDVIVGWAYERPGGGRAYATTLGHYYRNFQIDAFRRMVVNAILWTAKIEVPETGSDVALSATELELPPKPPPRNLRDDALVAWCIVPFDGENRGPAERAEMLRRVGLRRVAYDWREKHVPTFEAEILEYAKHDIEYFAFWGVHDEAFRLFEKHGLHPQIWRTLGSPPGDSQDARVKAAAEQMLPLVERTRKLGSKLGLYNHGGWGGEPGNLVAVCEYLRKHHDATHVGIVYNQHHGHAHVDDFAAALEAMKPYLLCLNLNGMTRAGDQRGQKILPLGAGELDVQLLREVKKSGYEGPVGLIGHTQDDVELRLRDNLDGLHWILPQLEGRPAGPKPKYRTHAAPTREPPAGPKTDPPGSIEAKGDEHESHAEVRRPPTAVAPAEPREFSPELVAKLVESARRDGDPHRGLLTFANARSSCLSCHRVGRHGGVVGPELTRIGTERKPAELVESILWPKRHVEPEYVAHAVIEQTGAIHQGYLVSRDSRRWVLRDPSLTESRRTNAEREIEASNIAEHRVIGTLMPDHATSVLTDSELAHLLSFVLTLGTKEGLAGDALDALLTHAQAHAHGPAEFPVERRPLSLRHWPSWEHHVNRDRVYDFYAKQADFFREQPTVPPLLAEYPGLDGGTLGHWGNQNDTIWADGRWNDTDLGSLLCGVFRGGGVTVRKGVCVRLGDDGELATCFNPETLTYDAVWRGGFVKFSTSRHGFLGGLRQDGRPVETPPQGSPEGDGERRYQGFYRVGHRVVFSYRLKGRDYLDAPDVKDGRFVRVVAPADRHPLRSLIENPPTQWPQVFETDIRLGETKPYAVDTIALPSENPWNALVFCGGHAFLPDGSALVATMQGDVWRVSNFAYPSRKARWRRFASGLHQALGIVADDDGIFVLGRDQITRLHDLNDDGEADFYECFSDRLDTSPGGHDFACGLERDAAGKLLRRDRPSRPRTHFLGRPTLRSDRHRLPQPGRPRRVARRDGHRSLLRRLLDSSVDGLLGAADGGLRRARPRPPLRSRWSTERTTAGPAARLLAARTR